MSDFGRVLVADDEATFRDTTAALLRRQGFECDAAPDSDAARALLATGTYDALIADIKMPGNADLEFIRGLAPAARQLPVILITGYPSVDTAMQAVGLPVIAYLVKPPDFTELLGYVRLAVEYSQSLRAVRSLHMRLDSWRDDLTVLEQSMSVGPKACLSDASAILLSLTLDNIAGCMAELRQAARVLAQQDAGAGGRVALMRAVEEAVEVLEKTKKSFKSRELAELRIMLEDALRRA